MFLIAERSCSQDTDTVHIFCKDPNHILAVANNNIQPEINRTKKTSESVERAFRQIKGQNEKVLCSG